MTKRLLSTFAKGAFESPLNYVNGQRVEPNNTDKIIEIFKPATGRLISIIFTHPCN